MELINTHCHSKYCGHGEGEIEQYVEAASKAGLTTLAFTEHFPLSESFDPKKYLSVPSESMDDYVKDVLDVRNKYPEMEILLGIEMDYLGDDEDRDLSKVDFDSYDLVLGSVHFVDRWPFDDPAQRFLWEQDGQTDRIWTRYIELWCDAASDKSNPYTVMSHPDLAKKFDYYPTFDLKPYYKRMAEAVRAGEKMVEVNTSGSYYACKEMFPSLGLLQEFHHAGVLCTVGTDAHVPENVTRDIEKGYDLLRAAGYREVTVPQHRGDLRVLPLD